MKRDLLVLLFLAMFIFGEEHNCAIIENSLGKSFLLNSPGNKRWDSFNQTMTQFDSMFPDEHISTDSLFKSHLYVHTYTKLSNTLTDGNGNSKDRFEVFTEGELREYNERKPYKFTATTLAITGGSLVGAGACVGFFTLFFASVSQKENVTRSSQVTAPLLITGASLLTVSLPFSLIKRPERSVKEILLDHNVRVTKARLNLECP